MDVTAVHDATAALDRLAGPLRAAGAEGELAHGLLNRLTVEPDAYGAEVTILIGEEGGRPLALVMMTGRHPALIVGFGEPDEVDYGALTAAMLKRGHVPTQTNGAVRWVEPFASAWREAGAATAVDRDMRAFELRTVRPPRDPGGRPRPAEAADAHRLASWTMAFGDDIGEPIDREAAERSVAEKTAAGDFMVWECDGTVVSMAAVVRRTPSACSIALVYTPPELRGRGYASAVVAALSQRELDAGCEWCSLFTDLANPTSNHIYQAIGYEPRADFRVYALEW